MLFSLVRSYQFKMLIRAFAFASRYMLNFTLNFILRFSCFSSAPLVTSVLVAFYCVLSAVCVSEQRTHTHFSLRLTEWNKDIGLRGVWDCVCASVCVLMLSHLALYSLYSSVHRSYALRTFKWIRNIFLAFLSASPCRRRRLSHNGNGNQNKWDRMRRLAMLPSLPCILLMWWMRLWNRETSGDATDANKILKFTANLVTGCLLAYR